MFSNGADLLHKQHYRLAFIFSSTRSRRCRIFDGFPAIPSLVAQAPFRQTCLIEISFTEARIHMQSTGIFSAAIGSTLLAAVLSGCGAGAGADGTPAAPAADSGRYEQTASYCQARLPGPTEPVSDGWSLGSSYTGDGTNYFDSTAIVSVGGSSGTGMDPVWLKVNLHDYRGIAGNTPFVQSGVVKPDWSMGVILSATMSAKSVACVAQLAKIGPLSAPATLLTQQPTVSMALYWRSFWNDAVPMAQLSGYQIDAFEFVSNFTPSDGQAFFTLDKQRYPAPQDLSICYLAAGASQWNCSKPQVSDQGGTWNLHLAGIKPGVYVLDAPTPGG
jgi:hypothetical protein